MPIGAPLHVAGTLECGPGGYGVRSGTGLTLIGYPRGARRLIGCEVEVAGSRIAFDEISCDRIWRRGEARPAGRALPGIEYLLIGAFTVYGFAASLVSLLR